MNLSASVGISYTTDPVMRIDDLIRESDTALYKAKQQGKVRNARSNGCIFENPPRCGFHMEKKARSSLG